MPAAAAEDQLLRLDEKLDLADAAASELDVMAGDRDLGMALHGVDLPLHRVDVGNRGVIEIFAPDEGRHFGQETLAQRQIAGDRARLDEGRALPVLAECFVIMRGPPRASTAGAVEAGSGRRRRSTRKT